MGETDSRSIAEGCVAPVAGRRERWLEKRLRRTDEVEAFVNGGGAVGLLGAGGAITVMVDRLSKVLVSKYFFRDGLVRGWISTDDG